METTGGKKNTTLRDVAAAAGVSPSVVSHVLNQGSKGVVRVSEATAERVRKVAEQLSYRVNVYARHFRDQQTLMIGVLTATQWRPTFDARSAYLPDLLEGIVGAAFEQGYTVALCPKLMGRSPADSIADGRFDGLIWYSNWELNALPIMNSCSVPLVLIHDNPPQIKEKFPCVACDNAGGIRLAVDHLVHLGHRKILFVADANDVFFESGVRKAAFSRYMTDLELSPSCAVVNSHDLTNSSFPSIEGETAIIACTDSVAAYLMKVASLRGISIPKELSIVGFDSTVICECVRPELTSVYQPLTDIGRSAALALIETISSGRVEPKQVILPCSLDIRKSTAPPKSSTI